MSDIDPAEVDVAPQTVIPTQFEDEVLDAAPPKAREEREGLPPGYRMRADAHYVDALTSRRAERAADGPRVLARRGDRGEKTERPERAEARTERAERAEARAERAERSDRAERVERPERMERAEREEPVIDAPPGSDRHEARARNERMLAQLAEDIATIESAAALLGTDTSRMARKANVDVIRAQAWRAAWLLRAKDILDGTHRTHFRPRPLAFLLGQVRNGLAAECRLTGTNITIQASDWNAVVTVDEQGLIAGLTGAIIATLGLLGGGEGGAVKVMAEASEGELRTVEVVQEDVMVTPNVSGRFFEAAWLDRPGGWTAGLGASTAKAVAQRHGGDAMFLAGERFGSVVKLALNRASWFEWE